MGLCLAAGLSGSRITIDNIHRWYLTLTPPPFTPPNAVFAPAWTTLYIMMGVAAWLIWRQPNIGPRHRQALIIWGWQLAINAAWTPVFFGLHLMLAALAIILALAVAILLTMVRFWPLSRAAALLLAPYFAWVCFASYLNAGFWWLNH